jgi:hypothetical protein
LENKLPMILGGERPSPPHGAAWGEKRTGEADRVLPERRKSAEPVKAGREGTSDPNNGPASKSAMERETEPMAEASSWGSSPTRKWVRQSQDLWSADPQLTGARQGHRGNPGSAAEKACKARRPESTRGRVGSYSGRGAVVELGNLPAFPPPAGDGWPKRPANARGGGGARIVVRGRESRPHGEGGQWIQLAGRRWTLCPAR